MKYRKYTGTGVIAWLILVMIPFAGIAQKSGGEKSSKNLVWEMQATSLASIYGMNEKETTKLSKAYVAMREGVEAQNKKLDKKSDPDEYAANTLKNEDAGQQLIKKDIDKIVDGEQAEEALLLLGSFNSRWESYQKTVLDFNLDKEKLADASASLTEYMMVYLKARKMADDAGERLSGRTATELKSNLDNSLSAILSQEQMAEWNVATQRKQKSQ